MIKLVEKHDMFINLLAFYFVSLVLGALNVGMIGSLLKVIAFLPAFWWLIGKHTIRLSRPLLGAIAFLGFFTLSILWSINPSETLVGDIGSVSLLILLCAASGYRYSQSDIDFLKKALIWSSRVTAVVILFVGDHYASRLSFGGLLMEDPNYLCAYYLFGVVNAVEMILSPAKYTRKLGYLVELGVYAALVIASGSRGGTLAIAAAVFVTGLGCLIRNKISLKSIFLPLLLVILSFALIFVLPYILPQEVISRFYMQEIIDSQGTGRYRIWQEYLHLFWAAPFWRQLIGYGNSVLSALAGQQRLTSVHVAHNIFVEHLIGVGLIGLFLYCQMLWQFIKSAYNRHNLFAVSVLSGIIVLTLSTSFQGKAYFNILIYIVCCVQLMPSIRGKND